MPEVVDDRPRIREPRTGEMNARHSSCSGETDGLTRSDLRRAEFGTILAERELWAIRHFGVPEQP